MIKYEHSTKRDGLKVYYYHREDHYRDAVASDGFRLRQLAHTIYSVSAGKFTKERMGRDEVMNAMLIVRRNRHLITDDMRDLVDEHA